MKARRELPDKLVALMSSQQGRWLNMRGLAQALGVSRDTVRKYLTPAVQAEVDARLANVQGGLAGVDAAMLALAQQGNVAAARLVYARQQALGGAAEPLPTLDELDAMVKKLRREA